MYQCPSCKTPYRSGRACPLCGAHLVEAPDARLGTQVGGVTLDAVIAESALAVVYRGQLRGQPVAVKIYRAALLEPRRVDRERDAQARIEHASVARLLDWGATPDGALFLVSEWIDGSSLAEVLAAGPLPWSRFAPILNDIVSGLAAIHARAIVHRDLKPQNLMLARGRRSRAVILDFGHSLVLDDERLTGRGLVVGSAAYMAPEQAAGQTLDGRADLYALGVITYRALTGALPFQAESAAELLVLHQTAPVVPPSRRAPACAIPKAIDELCLWLLAKEPEARVPNARVLAVTLRAMELSQTEERVA